MTYLGCTRKALQEVIMAWLEPPCSLSSHRPRARLILFYDCQADGDYRSLASQFGGQILIVFPEDAVNMNAAHIQLSRAVLSNASTLQGPSAI